MNLCTILCLLIVLAFGLDKVISTENVGQPPDELEQRREVLRNMTKEVWKSFAKDVLASNSSSNEVWPEVNNRIVLSAIAIAYMSTLWVMGLEEEFDQGREWIRNNFGNLSNFDEGINVRSYMNELVGSLLSCYALTNDTMLRDKAVEIAIVMQPAYDNQTGIPNVYFVPKTKTEQKIAVDISYYHQLADIGGIVLESRYLHSLAPEQFPDHTHLWRSFLGKLPQNEQLLPIGIDLTNLNWGSDVRSLTSSRTQAFYANLVKAYAQSNGSDLEAMEMFVKAIEAGEQMQMIVRSNGTTYIRDYWGATKEFDDYMSYEGCSYGAILALSSNLLETLKERNQTVASKTSEQLNQTISKHRDLAKQITETCHSAANQTATKLVLRRIYIVEEREASNRQMYTHFGSYRFESGLEESYLVLWRTTKEQKYREYAWELTQTYKQNLNRLKKQNSVLLSRVFKYLYLTFSKDSVLPLEQWVFSPWGHPLPICGRNEALPNCVD